jgi:hypothetical protein
VGRKSGHPLQRLRKDSANRKRLARPYLQIVHTLVRSSSRSWYSIHAGLTASNKANITKSTKQRNNTKSRKPRLSSTPQGVEVHHFSPHPLLVAGPRHVEQLRLDEASERGDRVADRLPDQLDLPEPLLLLPEHVYANVLGPVWTTAG